MSPVNHHAIGYAGAAFTTVYLVPQAWRIHRATGSQLDVISLPTFVFYVIGMILWLTYGVLDDDVPIVISTSVGLTVGLFIVTKLIRFRWRESMSIMQIP